MMGVFLAFLSWLVIFGGGILIMIYGWGIQPVSWGWIILGHLVVVTVAATLQFAAKNIN
jgi:hypothetical protein